MYDKNKLFAWYVWACDEKTGVSFPNKVHDSKDDRKKLPEAVIRLVTRLMFVWFVRQKGLIPSELFDRAEISKLLKAGFSPNARNDGTYYNAILQNLFFATLNSPESHRDFRPDRRAPNGYNDGYNCKTLYRFYTPREIVDYMTDESLKSYLKTKVPEVTDEQLRRLFDRNDDKPTTSFLSHAQENALNAALYDCRILDPACGSGAFPMGLLHRMTQLFGRLDPQCLSIRKKIRERYENDKDFIAAADWMTERERAQCLKDIEEQRDINYTHPDYTRKLFIIENCIFGVDIQPIATQISKLRFFISLLCDQLRTNWDAETKSYRLVSLPNLEAKFACANTLISLPKLEGELDLSTKTISDLRYRLARQRKRYFYARTYGQKKKAEADERQTRREIKAEVKRVVSTPDTHEIAKQTKMLSALEAEYEKVRSPKWVTVQKPTQGELFGETSQGELEFVRVDANAVRRMEIESAMAKARKKIAVEKAKATLKPQNLVLLDRIYYLKALQTMQLGFVIGVLNSRLTNFWFEYTYGSTKVNGGFFDLNGNQIKTILLPRCEVKFEDAISNLVDRILAAKKSDPNADTSALEAEIDQLVYKLYDLTPAEIDVVEGKDSKGDGAQRSARPTGWGPAGKAAKKTAAGAEGGETPSSPEDEYEELD